jgi:hypothetical protein
MEYPDHGPATPGKPPPTTGIFMGSWIESWTEHQPAPLMLTDKEILDWLSEYCEQATYNRATPERAGGFTLCCDDMRTHAPTLRAAACLAAAKWREINAGLPAGRRKTPAD